MKILINCSTLIVGGGIQVGLGFIKSTQTVSSEHEFYYLVSPGIYRELPNSILSCGRTVLVPRSPGTFLGWINFKLIMKNLKTKFQPDVVYSLGFPSYHFFSSPEIGRYTNPWDFFPEPLPWHLVGGTFQKKTFFYKCAIRRFFAKSATYIETQTNFAKKSIVESLNWDERRVVVIPNSINPEYYNSREIALSKNSIKKTELIAFCLSADHLHKNLCVIPRVCYTLKKKYNLSVKFILTLANNSDSWRKISNDANQLGVQDLVVNEGALNIKKCIEIYLSSTFVFLPTLLEVFSATYLEAMCLGVPIVTSDLDFAKDICDTAALYVNPYDTDQMAAKIAELLSSSDKLNQLVTNGHKRLDYFPDPSNKLAAVFSMFDELIKKKDSNLQSNG